MSALAVVSDFNAELVARYLKADRSAPACDASCAPYGAVFQTLAAEPSDPDTSSLFVWTRPEGVVPEFQRLLDGTGGDLGRMRVEVEAFANAIIRSASRRHLVLAASWSASRMSRGLGMLDWSEQGQASALARMNIWLADALADTANVYILDSQRWMDAARTPRNPRYWHTMKCPFTEDVCRAAAADIKAALRGVGGQSRKLVVLDLDNTLWGGVVGDDGWRSLRLGGHDAVGEAFVEFQHALKALSRRGIALAVVSKNDEAVALEAIDLHPEMIIGRGDLAGWRINWRDKAQNIVELTEELNLGLASVVFIDDNPAERGRVSEALPEVLTPDWPTDPTRYADALRQLDCFDQAAITREDRERVAMYVQARERNESLAEAPSMEGWLESLGIHVELAPVSPANLKRVVQLANKTNQLNLRTRRTTEPELTHWLDDEGQGRGALALTVSDRFGDIGLTGLVSWQANGADLEIIDFVLSCRAMGRQVENLMVYCAVEAARASGRQKVWARLVPTERNGPCLAFWRDSGFDEEEGFAFVWDGALPYPKPEFIDARLSDGAAFGPE